jgi:hypothetical protein
VLNSKLISVTKNSRSALKIDASNFIEPLKENYLLQCYLIFAVGGCSEHASGAGRKIVSGSGEREEREEWEIGERERSDEHAK